MFVVVVVVVFVNTQTIRGIILLIKILGIGEINKKLDFNRSNVSFGKLLHNWECYYCMIYEI